MTLKKRVSWLFLALFVAVSVQAEQSEMTFMRSSLTGGVGGYPVMLTCESVTPDEALAVLAAPEAGSKAGLPLRAASSGATAPRGVLPTHIDDVPEWARYPYSFVQDNIAGPIIPANYVHPHRNIVENGHLQVDRQIDIPAISGRSQFRQVRSINVPSWARQVFIQYDPDPNGRVFTNLWVRPDRPFESRDFPRTPASGVGNRVFDVEAFGYAQATHWAMNTQSSADFPGAGPANASPLSLWLHPGSDPAPAGRSLHLALSHGPSGSAFDDQPIRGRLRIWFSSEQELPPVAIQLMFPVDEYENRVGFFDDRPRVPDGDNPGETLGEAARWLLYTTVEKLLEELDLGQAGYLPVPVLAVTRSRFQMPTGSGRAGGVMATPLNEVRPLPDRFRGLYVPEDASAAVNGVHILALERAAGTMPCLLRSGFNTAMSSSGMAGGCRANQSDPQLRRSAASGLVAILRPGLESGFDEDGGFGWDLNYEPAPQPLGPKAIHVIRHEFLHVLGIFAPALQTRTYVHTFEPPLPVRLRPRGDLSDPYEDGVWAGTVDKASFIGPHTVASIYNPWANTLHPGIRLNDSEQDQSHLLRAQGDAYAQWNDAPEAGGLMRVAGGAGNSVGAARAMLLDMGLDVSLGVSQDRRLPRHLFDPERNGHGIDFRRVIYPNGEMVHLMHFYTYDADGNPTWYMAVGQMSDDGVFEADLDYFTYDEARTPPQRIDPDRGGTIRLDFYPSAIDSACASRIRGDLAPESIQVMHVAVDWEVDGEAGSWCMQPIEIGDTAPFPVDISGTWAASDPADIGWGLSVVNRHLGSRPAMVTVLYYYDANGEPTWVWGVAGGNFEIPHGSIQSGVDVDLLHFDGYCRTCAPGALSTRPAGSMRIRLGSPDNGQPNRNWIESLEISNPGPGGGTWNRSNIGLFQIVSPTPDMRR